MAFCKSKLSKYRLTLPDDYSTKEALLQLQSEKFWFTKIKRIAIQKQEEIRRRLGLINQKTSAYCSESRLRQFQWEKEQALEFMDGQWFCNADGEFIKMLDVYYANVSNPAVRRAELMVRVKGTEEYSQLQGHVGMFYTITAPSKCHSHYKSGLPNPNYKNYSVSDTHKYLCKNWELARSQLNREGIKVYGLRVVEPHHDGTPHWHLLLFMPPEHEQRVTEILRNYAFSEDANEPGAAEFRFKAEKIDPEKGSAQDYVAKYVCKNIDGEFLDTDKYGNDAKLAAQRITAWASLFKIRQFQFIGLPSVSLWRELRKVDGHIEDYELDQLRKSADSSDWLSYLLMMGGAGIPSRERPFALEYKKQIKSMFEHIEPELLSEHAYNSKPRAIVSSFARHPIADKGWMLFSSPVEQVDSPPAPRDGRTVYAAATGHRRFMTGPPVSGGLP